MAEFSRARIRRDVEGKEKKEKEKCPATKEGLNKEADFQSDVPRRVRFPDNKIRAPGIGAGFRGGRARPGS